MATKILSHGQCQGIITKVGHASKTCGVMGIPSGKHTKNYWKSWFQWDMSLFLWPFSIAFCMFTRPGIPYVHKPVQNMPWKISHGLIQWFIMRPRNGTSPWQIGSTSILIPVSKQRRDGSCVCCSASWIMKSELYVIRLFFCISMWSRF